MSKRTLTIVAPCYNEEEGVQAFLDRVDGVLRSMDVKADYVFVNDGSRDNTLAVLLDIQSKRSDVTVINLARNFGKEAAMTAGIDHAKGDAVVPMDVDLQDPPELLPEFVAKWRAGADTVYGKRRTRGADGFFKRVTAGWFYKLFNAMTRVQIPDNAGDYRLMDRRVVEIVKQLPERNRFMKGLFAWPGFSFEAVEYDRPARELGSTSWSFWKLWNFALDGITAFSTWPLRIWTYLGVGVAAIAFVYALFLIVRTLIFGNPVPGYTSLMAAVLFLGGVQLISIGVVGEYVGRIFQEVKRRPLYVIDRIY